jgi:quercetin dioxygenase-like cupin family protein
MPFISQDSLPSIELFPGYVAKMIHTESMTLVYWTIAAGAAIPQHSHLHEQVTHVLEGRFELVVDGVSQELEQGIIAVIPSNMIHYGHAITDCLMLDVFSPVREDYVERMNSEQ